MMLKDGLRLPCLPVHLGCWSLVWLNLLILIQVCICTLVSYARLDAAIDSEVHAVTERWEILMIHQQ